MFGPLGVPEILFILVLALLIFGPRRLPEVGRTLGKAMGEFRRATTELKRSVNTEIALEDEDERPRYTRSARRENEVADGAGSGSREVTTEGAGGSSASSDDGGHGGPAEPAGQGRDPQARGEVDEGAERDPSAGTHREADAPRDAEAEEEGTPVAAQPGTVPRSAGGPGPADR